MAPLANHRAVRGLLLREPQHTLRTALLLAVRLHGVMGTLKLAKLDRIPYVFLLRMLGWRMECLAWHAEFKRMEC